MLAEIFSIAHLVQINGRHASKQTRLSENHSCAAIQRKCKCVRILHRRFACLPEGLLRNRRLQALLKTVVRHSMEPEGEKVIKSTRPCIKGIAERMLLTSPA